MSQIFTPHELKTIEVDVEKKIFRVNGEDFGKGCTGFSIGCDAGKDEKEFLRIEMRIDATVKFASYGWDGRKTSEGERQNPFEI